MAPALSTLARPRPAAEEQFLEQTPWANPQHPLHQRVNPAQRQISQGARPFSPFSTPASRRPLADPDAANGSASTIAVLHSTQGSSVAPTPMTVEPVVPHQQSVGMPFESNRTPGSPARRNGRAPYEGELPGRGRSSIVMEDDQASQVAALDSVKSPEPLHLPASSPSKMQTSSSLPTVPFHGRFSSPFQDPHPMSQSPRDKSFNGSLHTRFPRQVSVASGAGSSTR